MRVERRIVASILFLLAACAPSYSAKQAPRPIAPVSPGDRLRVTHNGQCCTTPSIGLAESLSGDSLVLQSGPGTPRLAIARSGITQIERWNQGRTHMAAGGVLGLFAGAAAGGLIGYQGGCGHCDGDWRPLGAFFGALLGGGTGLIVGVLAGANRRGFWETIP